MGICCALLAACRGGSNGFVPGSQFPALRPDIRNFAVHIIIPFERGKLLGKSAGQPVYALFEAKEVAASGGASNVFAYGAPPILGKAGPLSQVAVQTSKTNRQFLYADARGRLVEVADTRTNSLLLVVYKRVKNPVTLDTVTTVCVHGKELGTFEEITRNGTTSTKYARHSAQCPGKVTGAVAFDDATSATLPAASTAPSRSNIAFYSCLMSSSFFPSAGDKFDNATHFSNMFAHSSTLPTALEASFAQLCAKSSLISLSKPMPAPACPGPACAYQPPPAPITTASADCATGTFNAPGQTCTISVPYNAGTGNTKFTAETSSSQIVTVTPASGTVTGSGTLKLTVTAGSLGGSATVTVTIGAKETAFGFDNAWTTSAQGAIATITLQLPTAQLPLGQTMTVSLNAFTADGQTIVGTYPAPIALSGTNMSISPSSVTNSAQAAQITVSWNSGFTGTARGTIQAKTGKVTSSATVMPGTGFAFYNLGTPNPNYDVSAFQVTIGPDGKVYYGTFGPETCNTSGLCSASDGAIGQLDPETGNAQEIELHSEVIGLLFTSDGALWMAGGPSDNLFRLPAGPFSAGALQTVPITIPAPPPSWLLRTIAQDGSGKIWITADGAHRIVSYPIAGPYDGSAAASYPLGNGPPGTPQFATNAQGVAYASDGNLYVADFNNGVIDRINPSSGTVTAQIFSPQQVTLGTSDSAGPRFITVDGSGSMFYTVLGDTFGYVNPSMGNVDTLVPGASSSSALTMPPAPSGRVPDSIGANGSNLYYADLAGGLGYVNSTSGATREYPIVPSSFSGTFFRTPNGVAVSSDGTAWFTCDGNATATNLKPLCIGHTVYLTGWSIFPGPAFTISGFGSLNSQPVGIMEAPAANSGPFTAAASNTTVCSLSAVQDHNFVVTGLSAGNCTVTVSDAAKHSEEVQVTVVPTPAPTPTPLLRIRHGKMQTF